MSAPEFKEDMLRRRGWVLDEEASTWHYRVHNRETGTWVSHLLETGTTSSAWLEAILIKLESHTTASLIKENERALAKMRALHETEHTD